MGSTSGGAAGWLITVTLTGGSEFQLPAGNFGYTLSAADGFSGPLLSFAGSAGGGADANGQADVFDKYTPDLATGTCGSFWFGGGANNFSSWWMSVAMADANLSTPPAAAASRNPTVGGFTNPAVYTVTGLPILGQSFGASVDTTGFSGCFLAAFSTPLSFPSNWGNILVNIADPNGELLGMPTAMGNPAVFAITMPLDLSLVGFAASTQAVRFGSGLDLTNAQDLTIGL